jgi:ADP-ribosylglycohydrolase
MPVFWRVAGRRDSGRAERRTIIGLFFTRAKILARKYFGARDWRGRGGSFKRLSPPEIVGIGYVAKSLEAALWAFHNSNSFREGCLLAVNLGDDADTTGAVYGQLAGAYYTEDGIPAEWRRKLALAELVGSFADNLHENKVARLPD